MPLLVGESMAACRKTGFHKLQTDRSVGTVSSYLPASEPVKRQSLHIFPRKCRCRQPKCRQPKCFSMFLPFRPGWLDLQVQRGRKREYFEDLILRHISQRRVALCRGTSGLWR